MGVIHEIVAECEKEIVFMNQVHDFVYGDERHNMINRLLRLNHGQCVCFQTRQLIGSYLLNLSENK